MATQPTEAPASAPATPAPAHGGPVPPIERAADAPPAVENKDTPEVQDFAEWEAELDRPAAKPEPSGDTGPAPAEDDGNAGDPPDANEAEGTSGQETPGVDAVALQRERDRADAAEARLRELEKPKEPAPAKADGAETDPVPDPDKYEFGEADARFIADYSRWNARQEFRAQEQQRAVAAEFERVNSRWEAEVAKPEVTEKYPDFAEKVTKGAKTGAWDCSPLMAVAIKDSEVGTDVAYHLATNPADASRIARLTTVEQAMEIGRLEGRYLAEKQSAAAKPQPTVVVSSAPPPPPQRSRGAGGKFAPSADTEDFGAFDKMADEILGGKKPY